MTAPLESPEVAARYRFCGLTLASEIDLPELIPATGPAHEQEPDITVRREHRVAGRTIQPEWFMSLTHPAGEPDLALAREPGGYRLRFQGLADFRVDFHGREIACDALEGIPAETIRHLLLDHVIPRALSLLGLCALHATAVLTPHGACAFAGPSGAGKSTLAASFHIAGYPVLSDDCLVLQQGCDAILAIPAYPGVRLGDNAAAALFGDPEGTRPAAHYGSKRRVLTDAHHGEFSPERTALARIYNLVDASAADEEFGAAVRIVEAIPAGEAFMSLVESAYRLDTTDRKLLARQFDFLERVASLVPVRRIRIPDDYSALPRIRDAILADLRSVSTDETGALELNRGPDGAAIAPEHGPTA